MDVLYLVTGGLVAIAASGVAIGQILRWGRSLARTLDSLDKVINAELDPHHDDLSIKDEMHAMARAIGILQRQVAAILVVIERWR